MPVAYGIWVYSAVVAWCFAMDACRSVSLMRFDATGRVATKLSSICPKATCIGHKTLQVVS